MFPLLVEIRDASPPFPIEISAERRRCDPRSYASGRSTRPLLVLAESVPANSRPTSSVTPPLDVSIRTGPRPAGVSRTSTDPLDVSASTGPGTSVSSIRPLLVSAQIAPSASSTTIRPLLVRRSALPRTPLTVIRPFPVLTVSPDSVALPGALISIEHPSLFSHFWPAGSGRITSTPASFCSATTFISARRSCVRARSVAVIRMSSPSDRVTATDPFRVQMSRPTTAAEESTGADRTSSTVRESKTHPAARNERPAADTPMIFDPVPIAAAARAMGAPFASADRRQFRESPLHLSHGSDPSSPIWYSFTPAPVTPPVTPSPLSLMPDPAWHSPDPAELVGDGIARFLPPESLRAGATIPPSLALVATPPVLGPVPRAFRTLASFAYEGGRWIARIDVPPGTSLYGAGELAGPLLRSGRRAVCWNTDSFEYDDTNESLYQSHPWVLGVRADGSSFGVLADTTFRCAIDMDGTLTFAAAGLPFAVYAVERDTPPEVVAALADLTGRMPLPPKWALGYHQSRWSYEPDARVLKIASEFRARRIPADCIWMDIDYMDAFRCFTFDREKFPDPARLNRDLHELGFKSVWMIDCGIKVEDPSGMNERGGMAVAASTRRGGDSHDGSGGRAVARDSHAIYASGRAGDHFVKDATGNEYHGKVWPGPCAFPDFTREATRRWWADLYRDFLATGPGGVWNDMNEPAVFDNDQKQVPEDLRHRADDALGGPDTHARYHNVYGMLMARATREGVQRARPDRRPFVLTRANFIGGQRYAATWTGDNEATWDQLAWSIPMVLNLGLSGQPFSGPDIGGFSGNADARLFARWMGIGALLPFARVHSIKDSADHEPWALGEACERTCRLALERRYRLMPYLYTLFHEASKSGLPIARPLFFADPRDPALRDADDSFLLGDDLLVRCRVEPDGRCQSPFPGAPAAWRPVELVGRGGAEWTDTDLDPDLPDLFIRAGAIIPIGPVIQYVDEKPLDPLTLLVCPDARGQARGTLYEDAGDGLGYGQGQFRLTTWHATIERGHLVIRAEPPLGRWHHHAPHRAIEVVAILPGSIIRTAHGREGKAIVVTLHAGDLRIPEAHT